MTKQTTELIQGRGQWSGGQAVKGAGWQFFIFKGSTGSLQKLKMLIKLKPYCFLRQLRTTIEETKEHAAPVLVTQKSYNPSSGSRYWYLTVIFSHQGEI